jgi:hypothetical protein
MTQLSPGASSKIGSMRLWFWGGGLWMMVSMSNVSARIAPRAGESGSSHPAIAEYEREN